MLDRLSPQVRHFLIACVLAPLAGLAGVLLTGIVGNGGFSGYDFATEFVTAANAAAVVAASGALGWVGLYITPLTRQYGVGSTPETPTPDADEL